MPPQLPTNRVVRIETRSSITGADTLIILVNEGFTAFIGGRGSGTSAVLEFLRFGFGRSELDIGQEDVSGRRARARKRSLIEVTPVLVLPNGLLDLVGWGLRPTWLRGAR